MATVDKDFRIKAGLVVEGANATVNGEDIITTGSSTDVLPEGTTNLYFTAQRAADAVADEIDTAVSTAVDALDTDVIEEGETNLYFTNQRAIDAVGGSATDENTPDTVVKRDASGNFAAGTVTVSQLNIGEVGYIQNDGDIIIANTDGQDVTINAEDIRLNAADDIRLTAGTSGDVVLTTDTGNLRLEGPNIYAGEDLQFVDSEKVATRGYVDDAIAEIDLTFNSDEITEGTTNLYFTNQRALDATSAAYDAAGAAATAEGNANDYTDTALESYTTTSGLDTAIDGLGYLKDADLSGYATETYVNSQGFITDASLSGLATETYVNDAVDALVDGAPGLLDTLNEIAAAIADDENYATTMTTALAGKQDELTAGNGIAIDGTTIGVAFDAGNGLAINGTNLTVDTNVIATKTYAEGVADTAEQNAKDYADTNFVLATDLPGQLDEYVPLTQKGAVDGVATLDGNGKVPASQLDIDVSGDISTAIDALTTDDIEEGEENLYFTDERAIDAVSAADIYPNAVIVNNVSKTVADTQLVSTASTVTGLSWAKSGYRSAKLVVKAATATHTQVSEIMVTLDASDNVAITEFGIVYTDEELATVTADVSGTDVRIRVTTLNASTDVTVVGTLLI
jgi:hypothetical protein